MFNYLLEEYGNALKDGKSFKRKTLSGVIANIKKTAIDRKCKDSISDDLVLEVLRKEEKTVNEMIDTCPEDRRDLKVDYLTMLEVLHMYIPKLITDPDDIRELIITTCSDIEFTMQNKGKIMKTMSTNFKGKVDMKAVQQVLTDMLK
jgi:uncharacterized protein YqeY